MTRSMASPMRDDLGAFCRHGDVVVDGRAGGPLDGLAFAAKDLFDVEGFVACAGSPEWLRTHGPARATAPAVRSLLVAGARLVGKTALDELAFSINGINPHYGTPTNARCPARLPGGSSSGSGVAAAAGLVDFALGSDTAGSVRIPASYNGVFGIRTTHGRIPLAGAVPLAPSFDVAGWFARDATLLERVGAAYFGDVPAKPRGFALLIAEDALAEATAGARAALAPAVERLSALAHSVERVALAECGLGAWFDAFRTIEFAEAWACHGGWITEEKPDLRADIRGRFAEGAGIDRGALDAAWRVARAAEARLASLLAGGRLLVLPTVPDAAPLKRASLEALQERRVRTLRITAIAGLGRLCEITVPAALGDGGCPLGLSLAAAPGEDARLLALVRAIAPEIVGGSSAA